MAQTTGILLGEKAYKILKHLVQVGLPAFGTLYFALASIWNLPNAEQVVGTTVALTTFLGILLGFSTKTYNATDAPYDGKITATTNEDGVTLYSLDLDDLAVLEEKKELLFKVDSR